MIWLDHAAVLLTLRIPQTQTREWTWRLNDSLLKDPQCSSAILDGLTHFLEIHASDTTPLPLQWEALKAVLRGLFIQQGARLKRERSRRIREAIQTLSTLETHHKQSPSSELLLQVSQARIHLLGLLDLSTRSYLDRLASRAYETRDKCGRALARSLHPRPASAYIPHIQSATGTLVNAPAEIQRTFADFYNGLYNLSESAIPPPDRDGEVAEYVRRTALPTLEDPDAEALESPFTIEELHFALKSTPTGKSPGPDGFTVKFYNSLRDKLTPFLLRVFNSIAQGTSFPTQSLEAHISLIPKPGKDHSLCSNYRPISLLNVDVKLFAKLIANRLKPLLPGVVHADQVGFVQGREARDNTIRTLLLMHFAKTSGTPLCLLSVDADKAFDRLDWCFLRHSLLQLGIRPAMLRNILALYSCPSARIRVNGSLSPSFKISNGTRQGCPLSPLLYVLTMEHLAVALRQDAAFQGLQVGPHVSKLALFADDLLLYVTHPHIAMPTILREFQRFGSLSNFKVNLAKSEILNVSLGTTALSLLTDNYPFRICSTSLKYLGVSLPPDLTDLFSANFRPMLDKLTLDLNAYDRKHISWLGRINVLKMDIVPRLLYLFQTVPIALPSAYLKQVQRAFTKFVWGTARPRLSYRTLSLPKCRGGAAAPDIFLYHTSAVLTRIVDWFHKGGEKQWVRLEETLATGDLLALPWVPPGSRSVRSSLPLLTAHVLKVWDGCLSKLPLSTYIGPMTPLFGNPTFPPALTGTTFGKWTKTSHRRVISALRAQPLAVEDPPNSGLGDWLSDSQFRSFVSSFRGPGGFGGDPTEFDSLLLAKSPPSHVVSLLYSLLSLLASPTLPAYTSTWERELDLAFSPDEWEKSFALKHSLSVASKAHEKNLKILTRWYRCPTVLHRYYPTVSDSCWRCDASPGNMTHIWWSCPQLQGFWQGVLRIYHRVTGTAIANDPKILLLSVIPGSLKRAKRGLLRHFLTAARTVIPRHWRTPVVPTLAEWVVEMDRIADLESLLAGERDEGDKYVHTWSPWIIFRNSDGFSALLSP